MSAVVLLSPQQVADATAMAQETHARWAGAQVHYRNLPKSHLRGKYGEIGVEQWAFDQGIS